MSLTPEQCEQFWAIADKDGSGCLDVHELAAAARQYDPSLTNKQITAMFVGIDHSGDKKISKDEFFKEMADKPKRSNGLIDMFKQYDKSGDGTLSRDELKQLIRECFKPEMVDDVTQKFFSFCDDGDGKITFEEFKSFFA